MSGDLTNSIREPAVICNHRIFSYIVTHDSGYSPNPFHGVCTLACCKPQVRRQAEPGDLILGLTGKARGHCLVYGMVVAEKMSFADYWHDDRFLAKRPDMAGDTVRRRGDNHYEPLPGGGYRQIPSRHSNKDDHGENPKTKARDLGPDLDNPVLVGGRFCYFGRDAKELQSGLEFLIVGRGHRSNFTPEQIQAARAWFESLTPGRHGKPHKWPVEDQPPQEPSPPRRGCCR